MCRAWKEQKLIKKQKIRRDSVRTELTDLVTTWHPQFAIDEESIRHSAEVKALLEASMERLDYIYFFPSSISADKIFFLYDKIDTQIQQIKKYNSMYSGYTYLQDAAQEISSAIRDLITLTTK